MTKNVTLVAKAMKDHYKNNEEKIRHFVSVYTLAKTIGELEKLPQQTQEYLELSALLYDVNNLSCAKGDFIKEVLKKEQVDYEIIDRVCYIVENFDDFDHITGLDHQILIEAHMIVDFKEQNVDTATIVEKSNARFMTNYGKAFLKRAFGV